MSGRPMSRMTTSMPFSPRAMSMPGLAVRRDLDVVAVLLEEPGERSTETLVVLDEEDLHAGFVVLCGRIAVGSRL